MLGCHRCGTRGRSGDRFCGACGATLGTARTGVRKTVTVLFADAPPGGSGDLESGVRLAAAFYESVRKVLEAHGGTVERHAGDAVMAVFGVPSARDDDARRAAAAGLALQELNGGCAPLAVGINTGEVLTGGGSHDQELAVGDAVVVAARLQQLASPGEVLLGPATVRALGTGSCLGPVRNVTLRGRVGLLPVVPLLGLEVAVDTGLRGPFIGREAERRMLLAALDRTLSTGLAQLVSVLGETGTGKSRLVRETLRERAEAFDLLGGVCRGYGIGSTWSALVEVVHAAAGVPLNAGAPAVVSCLASSYPELEPVLPVLASLLGEGELPVGGTDLAWAVTQVLSAAASRRPLVVVLEDVHLAHRSLLELLPGLVRRLQGAPVVVLVTARPELVEQLPRWGQGLRHVMGLTLRPLPQEQSRQLASALLPDDPAAVEALLVAAGGNPLFLTQLAQARLEGTTVVAPSVAAALAARLDRLPLESRQVLERAAVVGSWGSRADLRPLCEGELEIDLESELQALARKDLLELQDGLWAFGSELVRDAAAGGLAREERATIHHTRAMVMAAHGSHAAAGFHFDCASALLRSADPERSAELATRAAGHMAAAGLRSLTGDLAAAADLLSRATELMGPDEPRRLALLPDLARALQLSGDLSGAGAVLEEAVSRADALALEQVASHARLARLDLLRSTDPERAYGELPELLRSVLPSLQRSGDDQGLSLAYQLEASGWQYRVRWAAMEPPLEKALHHAHRAGDRRLVELAQSLQVGSMFHGPMHLQETRAQLERMLERGATSASHRASVEARLAATLALQGDPAAAQVRMAAVRKAFHDLGRELSALATAFMSGPVDLLAGEPDRAVAELRHACDGLRAMGDRAFTSTLAALLAEACWRCEDPEGAAEAITLSRSTAAAGDVISQVRWRSVGAKLLALEGRELEAVTMSAEALALVSTTDEIVSQGDVLADSAEVQELLGNTDAAQVLLRDAVHRYERKGAPQAIRLLASRLALPASDPLRPLPVPATAAGAGDPLIVPGAPVRTRG